MFTQREVKHLISTRDMLAEHSQAARLLPLFSQKSRVL